MKTYVENDLLLAGKGDTVVIFCSGHGASDPKWPDRFFFLTYDADPNTPKSTSFDMTGLEFLKRLDAKSILVIADACHSGGTTFKNSSTIILKSIKPNLERLLE